MRAGPTHFMLDESAPLEAKAVAYECQYASKKGNAVMGAPRSKWSGGVSELAILLPIKLGRVPGERQTYEERAKTAVGTLSRLAEQGLPNPFSTIPSLHFGRVMFIRPEQYLRLSAEGNRTIPGPQALKNTFDPYRTLLPGQTSPKDKVSDFRTWMLTLVIFDGNPMTYLREITEYIESQFDLLFENCEDYPYAKEFDKFWAWVLRHQVNTDLLYSPYSDLSVVRIKYLEAFKRNFDEFVAKVRSSEGRHVESMDDMFDEFLRESQQYASDFPHPSGEYLQDKSN